MVKLRNDFSLPALVMPEFLRPGSKLYALVPQDVHEATAQAASALSVDQVIMEQRLIDFCVREPMDPGPDYSPSTPTVRGELRDILHVPNTPSFGADFPFPKPPVKILKAMAKDIMAPLETRFSMTEKVKGGNLQVTIKPLQPDAPYFYFFRFLKGPPKNPAGLYFGAIYHTWRDYILFSHLASDYRTTWVYGEEDIPRMLKTGCDYIVGMTDFLDRLDQEKTN